MVAIPGAAGRTLASVSGMVVAAAVISAVSVVDGLPFFDAYIVLSAISSFRLLSIG